MARGLATRTTRTGAREFTIQEFVVRPLLLPDRSYTHSVRVYALVLGAGQEGGPVVVNCIKTTKNRASADRFYDPTLAPHGIYFRRKAI